MATIRKVLGQSAPVAATPTTLYPAPAGTSVVVSTLVACNRGTTDAAVRVAVRPEAAALADAHYIYFDALVPARDTLASTIGMTLAATDVVTVQSDSGDVSFTLFGEETT